MISITFQQVTSKLVKQLRLSYFVEASEMQFLHKRDLNIVVTLRNRATVLFPDKRGRARGGREAKEEEGGEERGLS